MDSPVDWLEQSRLLFRKVERGMDAEVLLSQSGWFPLADVAKTLEPGNPALYRKILSQREKALAKGEDTLELMGLKQFGSRIWAEMPVFSEWYRDNPLLQVSRVPKGWDLATFLSQPAGTFSLRGVLGLMPQACPLKYPTLKTLIRNSDDPQEEIGAEKIEGVGYVVYMPRFGEWLKNQFGG